MMFLLKRIADSYPDKYFKLVDKPTILLIIILRLRSRRLLRVFSDNFIVHFLDVQCIQVWNFIFEDVILVNALLKVFFIFFLIGKSWDEGFKSLILLHGVDWKI